MSMNRYDLKIRNFLALLPALSDDYVKDMNEAWEESWGYDVGKERKAILKKVHWLVP